MFLSSFNLPPTHSSLYDPFTQIFSSKQNTSHIYKIFIYIILSLYSSKLTFKLIMYAYVMTQKYKKRLESTHSYANELILTDSHSSMHDLNVQLSIYYSITNNNDVFSILDSQHSLRLLLKILTSLPFLCIYNKN